MVDIDFLFILAYAELRIPLNKTRFTDMKRRQMWTKIEENILKEELSLQTRQTVPTRKQCEDVLRKYKDTEHFIDINKVHVQDKCRKIIRKLQ